MTTQQQGSKTIDDLRKVLFDTLDGVKAGTIDLDRARLVRDIGQTLIETAKVEVDYLRVTGNSSSEFIDGAAGTAKSEPLPPGITTSVVHRLR